MNNKVAVVERFKVRQAEIKDAQRIAILCEQLEYTVTQQQVEQRLSKIQNDGSHIAYVATLANEYVIGWAHAHTYDSIVVPTQVFLLGLVVDKDYRHNGVGRLLTQQIENWATLVGCEGVLLRSNITR